MAITDPQITRPQVTRARYLLHGREIRSTDTLPVPENLSMLIPRSLEVNGTLVVDGLVMVIDDPQEDIEAAILAHENAFDHSGSGSSVEISRRISVLLMGG